MFAAARALNTHGKGGDLTSGIREPLTLSEVAFRKRKKKRKPKLPTYASTYFLKTYYAANKEVNFEIA